MQEHYWCKQTLNSVRKQALWFNCLVLVIVLKDLKPQQIPILCFQLNLLSVKISIDTIYRNSSHTQICYSRIWLLTSSMMSSCRARSGCPRSMLFLLSSLPVPGPVSQSAHYSDTQRCKHFSEALNRLEVGSTFKDSNVNEEIKYLLVILVCFLILLEWEELY